jgi:hypothetical protein
MHGETTANLARQIMMMKNRFFSFFQFHHRKSQEVFCDVIRTLLDYYIYYKYNCLLFSEIYSVDGLLKQ